MSQPVKTKVASAWDPKFKDWIQSVGNCAKPLIITIPHSGETIPPEAPWLTTLPETLLMFDVDRFVDQLYFPALSGLELPWISTKWHRYACDLNRLETDVDAGSVIGSTNKKGQFPRGLIWSMTTTGERLMPQPIDQATFHSLLERCFFPFHEAVQALAEKVVPATARHGTRSLFHLDLHSMPSLGTREHRDPGESRADLVISNQDGKSSSREFFEIVIQAARYEGFQISENWPYKGGRITEAYGRPHDGWQTVQIELNRKLYMDEVTKKKVPGLFEETQTRLGRVLDDIVNRL